MHLPFTFPLWVWKIYINLTWYLTRICNPLLCASTKFQCWAIPVGVAFYAQYYDLYMSVYIDLSIYILHRIFIFDCMHIRCMAWRELLLTSEGISFYPVKSWLEKFQNSRACIISKRIYSKFILYMSYLFFSGREDVNGS